MQPEMTSMVLLFSNQRMFVFLLHQMHLVKDSIVRTYFKNNMKTS